jgi:hypothetical protein
LKVTRIFAASLTSFFFFLIFYSGVVLHQLHGDEVFYIGREMQNIAFLSGSIPASQVFVSAPNHPFSGETIMGIVMSLTGHLLPPPQNPWNTHLTVDELDSARSASLLIGSFGVGALVYFALEVKPLLAVLAAVFLFSVPGYVEISMLAWLDVYLAVFTAASLMALYWYMKGNKSAVLVCGAFLGLALGSKLGWDPILAGLVIALGVLVPKGRNARSKTRDLVLLVMAASATFVITNLVYIATLATQLSAASPAAGRMGLTNLFVNQSITSSAIYSIFALQQPLDVLLFVFSVGGFLAITIWRGPFARNADLRESDRTLYSFTALVVLFVALDLIMTGSTFEYGRNYQRAAIYEGLAIVCVQGLIFTQVKSKLTASALFGVQLFVSLVAVASLLDFYVFRFPSIGWLVGHSVPIGNAYYLSAEGWLLLALLLASPVVVFLSLAKLAHPQYGRPDLPSPVSTSLVGRLPVRGQGVQAARLTESAKPKDARVEELEKCLALCLESDDSREVAKQLVLALEIYGNINGLSPGSTLLEKLSSLSGRGLLDIGPASDVSRELNQVLYGKPQSYNDVKGLKECALSLKRYADGLS